MTSDSLLPVVCKFPQMLYDQPMREYPIIRAFGWHGFTGLSDRKLSRFAIFNQMGFS